MRRERSESGKRQAKLDERAEAKRYEVLRVREAQSAAQEANKQNVQSAKQEKQSKTPSNFR